MPRELPAEEVQAIQSALGFLDPDTDYDAWIRIGMMLDSTGGGEQAFSLWDDWSSRATRTCGDGSTPLYPGPAGLREKWASFGSRQEGLTVGSLYHLARQAGWNGTVPDRVSTARIESDIDLTKLRLTHLSVGRLTLLRHRRDLHYCHSWGKPVVWDGRRWMEDVRVQANLWITQTQEWLKSLVADALAAVDEEIETCTGESGSKPGGDSSEAGEV